MKVERYGSGSILVAAFAIRRPATMNGQPWKFIVNRESVNRVEIIEMAARIDSDDHGGTNHARLAVQNTI
jgi:hypothetical protein